MATECHPYKSICNLQLLNFQSRRDPVSQTVEAVEAGQKSNPSCNGAVEIFQPDIGRTGVTEGMKLCALAELHNAPVAFHVSIGLGVQIAAALHVAASIPNLMFVECNPKVWQVAEALLTASLPVGAGVVGIPAGAGLGVEVDEEKLQPFITAC